MLQRHAGSSVRLNHCMQTNGTLINDEWCEFIKGCQIEIGVSLDGPKDLHDHNRKTRSLNGTFDRVVRGLSLLRNHDIPFHVISVLTRRSLADPTAIFEFFESLGIRRVHFNIEEIEGIHSQSSAL